LILGVLHQGGKFTIKTLLWAILLIGGLLVYWKLEDGLTTTNSGNAVPTIINNAGNNDFLTDNELVYTKHAKCRMDCRKISKAEVMDILHNGKVNHAKTRTSNGPCPSYALEGVTQDNQRVRIVFADCNNATKVVTAIDLENNYDCYCE